MDKLYRKRSNGRYEFAGVHNIPDLAPGIWVCMDQPYGRSQTSLVWRVGDLKRPVDVVSIASLQTMADELGNYLLSLTDPESEEFKAAKDMMGSYMGNQVKVEGINKFDLAAFMLRKISLIIENQKNEIR